jgi:hypothetical protein
MHRVLAAICLAVAPLVAFGTIYKVRMPDGSILFTDSPPPGGKIIEERQATPTPAVALPRPPARPASGATGPSKPATPAASARPGAAAEAVPQTLEAAMAEISDAERELAVARRRLETGLEPLPGERLGTAKGGSRLSPDYERRLAALEREVAEAETRAKRAYEARNALR